MEEVKQSHLKSREDISRVEDLRPISELNIQFSENHQTSEENGRIDNFLMDKVKSIVKNRRKYQASCTHKVLTFIPSCLCK